MKFYFSILPRFSIIIEQLTNKVQAFAATGDVL